MVFSGIPFLAYFLPVILLAYFFAPRSLKNPLLLLVSIIFYAWGAPKFIFVIIGTTALDFFLVKKMHNSASERKRKALLVLSAGMNLGLLFYFKYCNFFIENVNAALEAMGAGPVRLLDVVLPIGISFFTFESLTYVFDVYRRVHKPLDNFYDYQLYILLFPKLIAGPIIRYHEIADQMHGRLKAEEPDDKLAGFMRFVTGLCKKVFIANTMASYADLTFMKEPHLVNGAEAWIGMFAYTFQIYFDFSGYSDMAIGLGRFFGFRFPENFNNPYTSASITEFWKRWHITLGNWMRNYLYVPLGGNRKGPVRTYANLWVVFLASGLWHGAAWTFVFWGAYHGTLLVLERIFLLRFYRAIGRIPATIITFLLVSFGWIFFRSETLTQAFSIAHQLISGGFSLAPAYFSAHFMFYSLLALIFSFFTITATTQLLQEKFYYQYRPAIAGTIILCVLFSLAMATVSGSDFNPFIYFRF